MNVEHDDTLGTDEDDWKWPEKRPFRIYMGWDSRDAYAYRVASWSLQKHATVPIEIIPLVDRDLRRRNLYWRSYRVDHKGQMWDDYDSRPFSTAFSFTRFAVPIIEEYRDEWVLFTDPDVLWRSDIKELLKLIDDKLAVMCVQHDHHPRETSKMDGVLQTKYERKNWSSFMLINPARCRGMTPYVLNNETGGYLHALRWVEPDLTGSLPESWNWLDGHSNPDIDPGLIHFTRGTPDMAGHENTLYADEWRKAYREAVGDSLFIPIAVTTP